ncbi:hypothetical protein ACQKLN_03670 [Paenibacillus glucanolyticus]|uniref:hypothetical protein n=1 Tax=Paenibacillus glucanolyticus TaxID=59843 RepID=UPI0036BF5C13
MKLRTIAIVLSIATLLTGCESSSSLSATNEELESTKESLEKLKTENESLKKQLDELKYGPEKLLAEANSQFKSGDIKKLKKTHETIAKKYPDSKEEKQIKALFEKLQKQIDYKAAEEKVAAEKLAAVEKERQKKATASMRTRTDEVTGSTIYEDKSSPQYINDNGFNIFFVTSEGSDIPVLFARFQYTGDNWLFINKYTIRADNQTFTVSPNYSDVNRDNQVGGVWEYYDVIVDKEMYDIINVIIDSNKTIIRFQGDERHQDRTVTSQEKKALQNVLDAYKAMGGSDAQFKL